MTRLTPIALTALTLALAVGTAQVADAAKTVTAPKPEVKADTALAKVIQGSLVSKGPATMEDVIECSDVQKVCSQSTDRNVVSAVAAKKLEGARFKTVHYPADNTWLGDWKRGEKTAQSGRGMQFFDLAGTVNGANRYACHHLSKDELSYGTIDPSLYRYGKLRDDSETTLRCTWGKIYNSDAYAVCSNMSRSGHKGILTKQQICSVMVLLFDPASLINQ